MSTVNVTIYTAAWPAITTHPVEVRIYAESAPTAVLDSQIQANATIPHTWAFAGLPRVNLLFRIFEMTNLSDEVIVQQLGDDMYMVPPDLGGIIYKNHQQIEADVTPGFVSGVNTATFSDWVSWNVSILDRIGTGPMKRGIDYSYDINTGTITLLLAGDVFGDNEFFDVSFDAKLTDVGGGVPVANEFSSARRVTVNTAISAGGDFGGVIIADPAGTYMELTLPDITTVVPLRKVTIEMRKNATQKCCKIKTTGADVIDWLNGDLYICNSEKISLYRFTDTDGSDYWMTCNAVGNFMHVGEQVGDDNFLVNVYNKIMPEGQDANVLQYARFYNEYVLQLGALLVNYDDWATGSNKYCFSLANSANPANAGLFKVADRRNMFERITDGTRTPGALQLAQVGQFAFSFLLTMGDSFTGTAGSDWVGVPGRGQNNRNTKPQGPFTVNTALENRVINVAVNKYLYV